MSLYTYRKKWGCIQINNYFILDNETYLSDVRKCLENECRKSGLGKHIVKYYGLISEKNWIWNWRTYFEIFRYWSQHGLFLFTFFISFFFLIQIYIGGVHLLGGTNAGKSSLFSSLIDCDLCHIHALDCIQRATVSNLPGKDISWRVSYFYCII